MGKAALWSSSPSENGEGLLGLHKHRKRNSGRVNLPEFFF